MQNYRRMLDRELRGGGEAPLSARFHASPRPMLIGPVVSAASSRLDRVVRATPDAYPRALRRLPALEDVPPALPMSPRRRRYRRPKTDHTIPLLDLTRVAEEKRASADRAETVRASSERARLKREAVLRNQLQTTQSARTYGRAVPLPPPMPMGARGGRSRHRVAETAPGDKASSSSSSSSSVWSADDPSQSFDQLYGLALGDMIGGGGTGGGDPQASPPPSVPSFLPLDMFDNLPPSERPSAELEARSRVAGVAPPSYDSYHDVYGASKYFKPGGEFTWERCRVLGWDAAKNLYQIEFTHNKQIKWVSRFNLVFEGEDEARLAERQVSLLPLGWFFFFCVWWESLT